MTAVLTYHSWVRRGLGAGATGATSTVDVSVTVSGPPITRTLALRGPGDVIGLEARTILRMEPRPDSSSFEPNYFPFAELAPADLPWRYTPGGPDARGRLRPWIVLIAVRERKGVSLATGLGGTSVLEIADDAGEELPDLAESWAWAHVQATVKVAAADLAAALDDGARPLVARLCCPRRLQPRTRYIACLVPAFAAGVRSGLDPTAADQPGTADAWSLRPAPASIRLPVYASWRFGTGEAGDFETLVRRLQPRVLPKTVGVRPLALAAPGAGLPALAGSTASYIGPLIAPASAPQAWQGPGRQDFQTAIAARLSTAADTTSRDDPSVAPPRYGERARPDGAPAAPWVDGLNLDPGARAAAGVGARVVRRIQEELVDAAWDQGGDLAAADALVRRARLAATASSTLTGRLLAGKVDGALVQVTRPLHGRAPAGQPTIRAGLDVGDLPGSFVSAGFRRVARPRGPVGRALRGRAEVPTAAHATAQVAAGRLRFGALTARLAPAGLGLLREEAITGKPTTAAQTARSEPAPTPASAQVRDAATRVRALLADPLKLVRTRIAAQVAGLALGPGLPARATFVPSIQRALALDVAAIDPELLVPGVSDVADDTVSLLSVYAPTVEAIVVGANDELSRELAWREYPTDPGATSLRSFWGGADEIPPVAEWTRALGGHLDRRLGAGSIVLLVRGELVHRYPEARYYAVRAAWSGTVRVVASPEERRECLFSGRIDRRTLFLGLPLGENEARGSADPAQKDAGWFLTIEQPPTGPRFGLDEIATQPPSTATWDSLTWPEVVPSGQTLRDLTHVSVARSPLAGQARGGVVWGDNAAQMSRITFQRPARVYVHASVMLPRS